MMEVHRQVKKDLIMTTPKRHWAKEYKPHSVRLTKDEEKILRKLSRKLSISHSKVFVEGLRLLEQSIDKN